jgi:hypothetical protein
VDAGKLSMINQRALALMRLTQRNAPWGCPAVLILVSEAEDGGAAGLAVVPRLRDQADDLISNLSSMDPLKAEKFLDQADLDMPRLATAETEWEFAAELLEQLMAIVQENMK